MTVTASGRMIIHLQTNAGRSEVFLRISREKFFNTHKSLDQFAGHRRGLGRIVAALPQRVVSE